MAANSLYPSFVKLFYTSNAHQHVMIIPVKAELVGEDWLFRDKGGNLTLEIVAALTPFITVIKPFYHTSANFDFAELWTLASPGADPVYVLAEDLNIAGTGAAAVAMSQMVLTFRTVGGGLYRLYLMEQSNAANAVQRAPFTGAYATINTYITGSGSIIAARDGSYLSSMASAITKINDALRKKYLLNV